jgi:hypothetical protein
MDAPRLLFDYNRRFGVELEYNAFDGLSRPVDDKQPPEGIRYFGNLVSKVTGEFSEIRRWGYTHWSNESSGYWVIKPDGSCGLEVCSPVVKGAAGINSICNLVEEFAKDSKIKADKRCSLHIHVETREPWNQIANVVNCWIKCEQIFMDAMPRTRRDNRYCQSIGLWDWLKTDTVISDQGLINLMGNQKYLTFNTYHLANGRRPTVEFRIADSEACKNPYYVKNWIKLIIHFFECAKNIPRREYCPGDIWSNFVWIDPIDLFNLLGFNDTNSLSEGLLQVRNWFLARLYTYAGGLEYGCQSKVGRRVAMRQIKDLVYKFGINVEECLWPQNHHDAIYNKIYST